MQQTNPTVDTNDPPLPFIAFVSDDISAGTLRAFVRAQEWQSALILQGSIRTAIRYLEQHRSPDWLLIEATNKETIDEDMNRLAEVCEPHVRVLVTGTINEFSFYKKLQDMGVEDYLLKPLHTGSLREAVSGQQDAASASVTAGHCKVIGVMGSRGGVGATTIASNLGWIMANRHHLPTAILDPDLHFGEVSLAFDVSTSQGLRDALEKPERIDSVFVDRLMVNKNDRLHILSAEEPFEENVTLNPEAAAALIQELRLKHSTVIIDMPHLVTPFSRAIIDQLTDLYLVTELTVCGLRDVMRLQDMVKQSAFSGKPIIVANREGLGKKHEMRARDFEKSLGLAITHHIPFEADAYGYDSCGQLIAAENAGSRITKTLENIARDIAGDKSRAKSKTKKAPWWKSVFSR